MKEITGYLFATLLFAPTSLALAQGDSFLGGWQPPEIYASNTWYSKTAPFSSAPLDTITSTQWQLEWNLNNGTDGVPSGMQMKICDAAHVCTTVTSLTGDGSTSYFAGLSADQTFTFSFMIPASRTIEYNPPYIGVSANSWLLEYYQP